MRRRHDAGDLVIRAMNLGTEDEVDKILTPASNSRIGGHF